MTFSKLGLNKNLQKAIKDLGFVEPTPIQKDTIPYLINENKYLIALAQTGTGKTAAFGLPIIEKIEINRKIPQSIILCPTRELCLQITKDMDSYAKYIKGLKITAVYGGANIQTQIRALTSGTQIVVGTPGRVIDLIKRKKLKLNDIETVVLDEADEMLNMGFKEDLDTILAETPEEKQTLLFSATMPKEVMRITKNYMFSPKTIEVARRNEGAENVEHHYYMVNARDRYKALRRICDINTGIYGIVFCRTRRETKDVADKLMQDGYNADALHGELSQSQRDHVMQRFRRKSIQLLVATDVAARGIDINELSHVINYNLPDDNEIYVHRSGRTGRAGNKGISIIIAHSRERRKIQSIEKMLKRELILKQVPNGEEICEIQLLQLVDKVVNTEVSTQINKYLPAITEKLAHLDKEELLKHFISAEFNRFLSFYKNASNLNVTSNSATSRDSSRNNSRNETRSKSRIKTSNNKGGNSSHAEEGYTRFFINLGNQKNMQAQNLIGMINEFTKKRNIPVGKIDIFKNFSFFEVDSEFEGSILSSFKDTEWNGERVSVEISKAPGSDKGDNKQSTSKRKTFRDKKETNGRRGSSRETTKSSSSKGKGSFKSRFSENKKTRTRR
jgi:ATP-dependent RNA helicase DeaD